MFTIDCAAVRTAGQNLSAAGRDVESHAAVGELGDAGECQVMTAAAQRFASLWSAPVRNTAQSLQRLGHTTTDIANVIEHDDANRAQYFKVTHSQSNPQPGATPGPTPTPAPTPQAPPTPKPSGPTPPPATPAPTPPAPTSTAGPSPRPPR